MQCIMGYRTPHWHPSLSISKQLHIRIHIPPSKNTENMTRNRLPQIISSRIHTDVTLSPASCHLLWCISVIRQNCVWHTDAASIGSRTDTAEEICSYDQCLHSIIRAFGHFFARNHMMCCMSFDFTKFNLQPGRKLVLLRKYWCMMKFHLWWKHLCVRDRCFFHSCICSAPRTAADRQHMARRNGPRLVAHREAQL